MTLFLAWTPFLDPIPIWSNAVWPWLLLPLAACVATVYKTVKCHSVKQVPREAASIATWIVLGMLIAAVVLAGVVRAMEW